MNARPLICGLLLAILASCRLVCATTACEHAAAGLEHASQEPTAPHPVNDDQCVCNGGLQDAGVGHLLSDLDPFGTPTPIDLWPMGVFHDLLGLLPVDSPDEPCPDPGPHASSRSLCAQIQRFRL